VSKRMQYCVLVFEEDLSLQEIVKTHLEKDGYKVVLCLDTAELLAVASKHRPNVILLDIEFPGTNGFELLKSVRKEHPDTPLIIITNSLPPSSAIEYVSLGAHDFISTPIDLARLSVSVKNAVEFNRLINRYSALESMHEPCQFNDLIGVSAPMQGIYQLIKNVGRTDATAFITGESGTGKELIARALHQNSLRAAKPMVIINCAAIPNELLESELFGHEKGSFTGAYKKKQGNLEIADGGTVFLDEICEMPISLQAKLLRFIQERKFIRVGGHDYIKVDVRIIAATNKNPATEVNAGRFREDLYYRLLVVPIEVPSLRERREDIPLLAMFFLEKFAVEHKKKFFEFSPEAMKLIINYSWRGNVRELENVIESVVVLHDSRVVFPNHLPEKIVNHIPEYPNADKVEIQVKHLSLDEEDEILPFSEFEKRVIEQALRACDGCVVKAAKKLRLGQATVYRKIKTYGIAT
jgi:DNA-binding NtrC family response regulator